MRINRVEHARKDGMMCRRCRKRILVGDPYRWIKHRRQAKIVHCTHCNFRASELTTSEKKIQVFEMQEMLEDSLVGIGQELDAIRYKVGVLGDADIDDQIEFDGMAEDMMVAIEDLNGQVEEAIQVAEEVSDGYRESAQNLEEYFSGSSQIDDCEMNADYIDEWKDSLSQCEVSLPKTEYHLDEIEELIEDVQSVIDSVDAAVGELSL